MFELTPNIDEPLLFTQVTDSEKRSNQIRRQNKVLFQSNYQQQTYDDFEEREKKALTTFLRWIGALLSGKVICSCSL